MYANSKMFVCELLWWALVRLPKVPRYYFYLLLIIEMAKSGTCMPEKRGTVHKMSLITTETVSWSWSFQDFLSHIVTIAWEMQLCVNNILVSWTEKCWKHGALKNSCILCFVLICFSVHGFHVVKWLHFLKKMSTTPEQNSTTLFCI